MKALGSDQYGCRRCSRCQMSGFRVLRTFWRRRTFWRCHYCGQRCDPSRTTPVEFMGIGPTGPTGATGTEPLLVRASPDAMRQLQADGYLGPVEQPPS